MRRQPLTIRHKAPKLDRRRSWERRQLNNGRCAVCARPHRTGKRLCRKCLKRDADRHQPPNVDRPTLLEQQCAQWAEAEKAWNARTEKLVRQLWRGREDEKRRAAVGMKDEKRRTRD